MKGDLIFICECCGTHIKGKWASRCGECRSEIYALRAASIAAIAKEVNSGRIMAAKNYYCVDCGRPANHYDHRDYNKPLVIEPVCRKCNYDRGSVDTHKKFNRYGYEGKSPIKAREPIMSRRRWLSGFHRKNFINRPVNIKYWVRIPNLENHRRNHD